MSNSDSSVQFDFKPPVSKEEAEAHMQVIARFLVDLIREYRGKHSGEGNTVSAPEQGSEPYRADEQRAAS
jgi:hypothetical protein